ncbi:MAG: molybdate ABC transporter substrate-binding protein [Trichocoleus desertorum ATA4-8-CV12]|jgi:molybdate transport system substrate-binding protein|nr:molybdate ABC transporter substrate-binding protein [Trichocoleus desertorum ATA4-8-CV12]
MNKHFGFVVLGVVTFVLAIAIAACSSINLNAEFSTSTPQNQPVALTISAAASLTDVMEEVRLAWQQERPDVVLTFNFGSSGSLQAQIEQGAPVDIFVSAASKQMDALQKQGLILTDTRKNLLTNQVVLIEPRNASALKDFFGLRNVTVQRIAIGDPVSVPVGKYSQEVLTSLGIFEAVKPKLILTKDVRQVLSYVETGNVDAGIVYLTDAKGSEQVRIVAIAPEKSHSPVAYPIAVLRDSKNIDAAQKFEQFLFTQQAKAVFQKHGFGIAEN